MRQAEEALDHEDRCNRLMGSIDAIRDLVAGQGLSNLIKPSDLAWLLDLVAAETHDVLERKDDVEDPERPRGGPLRAVD
jgi:hypothetical protein